MVLSFSHQLYSLNAHHRSHHSRTVLLVASQSGDCGVAAARESAERMRETLVFVRQALPAARVVVQALLPKGDFWPNRCTPAFDAFNTELQVCDSAKATHRYQTETTQMRLSTAWYPGVSFGPQFMALDLLQNCLLSSFETHQNMHHQVVKIGEESRLSHRVLWPQERRLTTQSLQGDRKCVGKACGKC